MRVELTVAILLLSLVAPAILGGAAVGDSTTRTVSGPAVPMPGEMEERYRQNIKEVAESYGGEFKGEVFMMSVDGEPYIVTASQKPKAGEATVRGDVVSPDRTGESKFGLIFAHRVRVSQSGPTISAAEYNQSKDDYTGQVVHVRGHYREMSYILDSEGVRERFRVGTIAHNESVFPMILFPGQSARELVVNSSFEGNNPYAKSVVDTALFADGRVDIPNGWYSQSFWSRSKTEVTLLVLPEEMSESLPGVNSFTIGADVLASEQVTPSEILQRGDEFEGAVMTVRGQAAGSQISVQESFLAAAECAPESITVPGAGCVPIPTDVSIHSGAVASAGDPEDTVAYVGLSNDHQERPMTIERGEYVFTGRVVSTSRIDPRLPDGYALIVYQRNRVDDFQPSGDYAEQIINHGENITNIQMTQLTMTHAEYRKVRQSTPTPTATPTPTETPTRTSMDAPTPTSTENQDAQTPIRKTDEVRFTPTETSAEGGGLPLPSALDDNLLETWIFLTILGYAGVGLWLLGN